MVTWAHDAYDVREASSFYKKTSRYKKFAYPSLPAATWKIPPPHYTPKHQIFIPLFASHQKSTLPPTK